MLAYREKRKMANRRRLAGIFGWKKIEHFLANLSKSRSESPGRVRKTVYKPVPNGYFARSLGWALERYHD
jgi:hypothetical protein